MRNAEKLCVKKLMIDNQDNGGYTDINKTNKRFLNRILNENNFFLNIVVGEEEKMFTYGLQERGGRPVCGSASPDDAEV